MKLFLVLFVALFATCNAVSKEEIVARDYLRNINKDLAKANYLAVEASWVYNTNVTDENEQEANDVSVEVARFNKEIVADIERSFNWKSYTSADMRRQFKKLTSLGYTVLSDTDYATLLSAISAMSSNYAKVKVCDYNNSSKCDLALEPEITEIFAESRDPKELEYYWVQWYDKAGTPVKKAFETYVEYNTKAAQMNNFSSGAEMWLSEYEDDTFEQQLEDIFETLRPLYNQLHAYVRDKLYKKYGASVVSRDGPIPMHLLGNPWAQDWQNVADIVAPFPDKPTIDVTQEMINQNYDYLKMFKMAEDFFVSMGLKKLPQDFWDKSVLVKPADGRDLICHASAWDFYLIDDVRIKMCTVVNQDEFFTIHHELGHIQYYLQYQDQPFVYRTGANPGFHEAVGDVLSLSVATPRHLETIGLLSGYVQDEETKINQLLLKALEKIAFLPFAYTLDKYRWSVFRGEIEKKDWNCGFWDLREQLSGVKPPVVRTENDFDPPAKYHISADTEYLRYLVSFIIQFDFYKSACIKAGQYDPNNPEYPLDNCDIYGSKAAGEALSAMLKMGASKPWPDALEAFNGKRTMTADAIVEYFEPLRVWLEAENKKNNVPIGWIKSNQCVSN